MNVECAPTIARPKNSRLLFQRLGEREGEVRGHVAMRGIAGPLELDGVRGRAQPRRGIRQSRTDHLERLHLSPESFFFVLRSAGFVSAAGFDSAAGFPSSF